MTLIELPGGKSNIPGDSYVAEGVARNRAGRGRLANSERFSDDEQENVATVLSAGVAVSPRATCRLAVSRARTRSVMGSVIGSVAMIIAAVFFWCGHGTRAGAWLSVWLQVGAWKKPGTRATSAGIMPRS